ncbi:MULTISPECIES: type II toxin-antitoxin system RelB family antitoxin [unclassified Exiguobacterium]|uniref:type II toxin-antitoxin system RelB family antitoxin n=1 Tax=unclassified Exiguobacterium TaxID=2644629 RepID=UPI0010409D2E|nr:MULTISPECIES: DUF6290 family protein [unclassified Exiguobacterium]TCI73561.1 CopG family transcriptional regulator [Exiguobacterium sp. IPCI3]TCI82718.1 CopG family transcriptional regulator [Exiguobacterium sp. IPCH1]TCI83772.1 CopG family transcriptional regulator [Exiguobacterium sp. IPBC4]
MRTISFELNEEDERLIRAYAKSKNLSLLTLVRDTVFERIENELDLKFYNEAMHRHKERSETISFEDMMKDLN